ncbi:MAG: 16S rRNA (uracil(1498)-N(3))-methyltransferase [Acidobacteriaceae bacterium]|nr:16S rRNA (uracil(1498)-N(3))-methyltransferase [Acidobacteriaceae bacterium]
MHRFFAPSLDSGDAFVTLPRDEAEHLTRVLRLGVGETVAVFDGRGREFLGKVQAASRRDVQVQILSPIAPAREWGVHVTLVQAVLKGDRMDDVVRDGVMLGVAAIQPIVTKRTETTIAQILRGARDDRWRRIALASAKQCRRAVVPEIQIPLPFASYLVEPAPELRLMLVEPSAESAAPVARLSVLRGQRVPMSVALLVGPEGGWDREEVAAAASSGITLVSLGDRTLRADATPIAALSILDFLWEI